MSAALSADRGRSVFCNVPFDEPYLPLLRAMLFTIHSCGFVARTALEDMGGAEQRLHKIIRLIGESRYSIHDLSRVTLDKVSQLPRANMPFEAGIAMGAIHFGHGPRQHRDLLILCGKAHQDKAFLSDLAGQDSRAHDGDPRKLIEHVRGFLAAKAGWDGSAVAGDEIARRYKAFQRDLPRLAKQLGTSAQTLLEFAYLNDWLRMVARWLPDAATSAAPATPPAHKRAARKRAVAAKTS